MTSQPWQPLGAINTQVMLMQDQSPTIGMSTDTAYNTSMAIELRHRAYINERLPNRATFFNDAKRSYGKQSLYNRLEVLKELNFDCINMDNDDLLRVDLKKTIIFILKGFLKFSLYFSLHE